MCHPTADFVYEQMRKELPNISLATVYRNLNQLAEAGLIRKVEGLDGSVHLIIIRTTIIILFALNVIKFTMCPVKLHLTWTKKFWLKQGYR